jgi:hypothetical protein
MALALVSLAVAAVLWLPALGWLAWSSPAPCFDPHGIAPKARMMAAEQVHLWTDPAKRRAEVDLMRSHDAEWDFMGRSFVVWALANMAMREPDQTPRLLLTMDRIIDDTVRLDRQQGPLYFLMPYARNGRFEVQPPRSLFVDGEIALMFGMRRMVADRPDYRAEMAARIHVILDRMGSGPVLCAESYPNECWMFCNAVALDAVRAWDCLEGDDHSAFFAEWVRTARSKLVDPKTGLLISRFMLDGTPMEGPEGSTIWMVAHCLAVIDPDFARDQYDRAKAQLARGALSFAYSREWPASWEGEQDVDAGAVVPVIGASPSASGLALIAARTFDDRRFYAGLLASLDVAGVPSVTAGRMRYCASNQVGDAVILYSMVCGPVWQRLRREAP